MDEHVNEPVELPSEHPAEPVISKPERPWYEIWWDVWRHPGSAVFQALEKEQAVESMRGYIWVAVSVLIGNLISLVITLLLVGSRLLEYVNSDSMLRLIWSILGAPFSSAIGLAIASWIYHWLARRVGGNGDREQLTFSLAAIQAPAFLIFTAFSVVMTPYLTAITENLYSSESSSPVSILPGLCLYGTIGLAISVYSIVLSVSAIKGVMNLDTGKAVLTFFIPVIVVVGLYVCMITLIGIPWAT